MDWPKTVAITLSILALAGIVVLNANGIRTSMDGIHTSMDTFRTEAAADRRVHQAAMDIFRQEMRVLAERQAHVEGQLFAGQ